MTIERLPRTGPIRKWALIFQAVAFPVLAVLVWPYLPFLSAYLVIHIVLAVVGWFYVKAEDEGREADVERFRPALYIGVALLLISFLGVVVTGVISLGSSGG